MTEEEMARLIKYLDIAIDEIMLKQGISLDLKDNLLCVLYKKLLLALANEERF